MQTPADKHTPTPRHGRCATHRPLEAAHDFDPASGHCIHGCGNRDDGLLVNVITGRYAHTPGPALAPVIAPQLFGYDPAAGA